MYFIRWQTDHVLDIWALIQQICLLHSVGMMCFFDTQVSQVALNKVQLRTTWNYYYYNKCIVSILASMKWLFLTRQPLWPFAQRWWSCLCGHVIRHIRWCCWLWQSVTVCVTVYVCVVCVLPQKWAFGTLDKWSFEEIVALNSVYIINAMCAHCKERDTDPHPCNDLHLYPTYDMGRYTIFLCILLCCD